MTERPLCQARNSATELHVHVPSIAPSRGLELRGVLGALGLDDGRRRESVDAADAFRHPAEDRELAGDREAAFPERRSAERAVVVGVDEARRERAPAGVVHAIGGRRLGPAHCAQRDDDVAVDQDVAGEGRRAPVAGDNHGVADQLAGHGVSPSPRLRYGMHTFRKSQPSAMA